MLQRLSQVSFPFKAVAVVILFLICYAIAYKASNCESEQGMAVFPFLLLLKHMQVILDDDSFAGETMNCMNQTFTAVGNYSLAMKASGKTLKTM